MKNLIRSFVQFPSNLMMVNVFSLFVAYKSDYDLTVIIATTVIGTIVFLNHLDYRKLLNISRKVAIKYNIPFSEFDNIFQKEYRRTEK